MKEGDDVTAEDLMTTLLERGLGVVSSSAYKGFHNASVKDAIAIVANDGGGNLNVLWGLLLQQINLLHDVVGVPKVDTGGGVSPQQGKAVTQMLMQGSDNVLSGLLDSKIRLYSTLWENLMYDILNSGEAGVARNKPFAIPPGNPNERIPNLVVEPLPTDAQWQDLYDKSQAALTAGLLTMDQYVYLKMIDNMKQAWGYLAVQQKRAEMKRGQSQQMADQANTERQMQSNAQAQQGKEKLEQLKTFGNVIQEYAKAAFSDPMKSESPDIILQRIQIELNKMYGTEQQPAGQQQLPSGAGEQQQQQPDEQQLADEQLAAEQQQYAGEQPMG
jgi:hypothetical protein